MNRTKAKYGMNLTEGSIFRNLIIFIIPIALSNMLQQLYNMADTIIVGKFAGDSALAAVGSTGSLTNLMLNIFYGLSIGATVTCAKFFGANDGEKLNKTVHTAISLAIVSGVFLAIVGFFFAEPLLDIMGSPEEVLKPAARYMKIIFLGCPVGLLYNFGAGILRAGGDTKRPLYILAVAGIINVALNMLCVIVFGLAEVGVAIGTVASQTFSAVMVLITLSRSENAFRLYPKRLRFHKEELLNIIKVGIPSGINGILFNFANVILQSAVNSFGKTFIAGSAAAGSVETFIYNAAAAAETGATSFVGQNYGAKKYKRIDKAVALSLAVGLSIIVFLGGLVLLFEKPVLGFFTNDDAVVLKGQIKLTVLCISYLTYVPSMIMSGALKGVERSSITTVINVVSICASRLVWILGVFPLYSATLNDSAFRILYLCYPISWSLSSISQIAAYFAIRSKLKFNKSAE